jgi:hypothetical protein
MYDVGRGEFWGEDESAGRYYGLEPWLTPRRGPWGQYREDDEQPG